MKKTGLIFSYIFLIFGWNRHAHDEDWWAVSRDVALQSLMVGACAALEGISSQEHVGKWTGANADYSQSVVAYYAFLQAQPVGDFVPVLGSYSSLKVLNNEN